MYMKTEELLLDRYKIISKLGRGGFADVYKAFDTRMERVVAIKQIHVNRHSAERVLREARTVALLNHPNIVTIHEFEEDGDDCYLIMELIEGIPLSKILSRISPLSVHEALIITIEICRALEAAHLNGIIHRDIKPENIMILYDGRLKVMDFGIARFKGGSSATDDDIIGTFAYMSPEQARGDAVDERSDIWSLGTMLYEMLTDCIPFSAESATETLNMVQKYEPFPPSRSNPEVSEELDRQVMMTITKNPDERYVSATVFRENLIEFLPSHEPAEKVLSGLVGRYISINSEMAWAEETGWRGQMWRFIEEHKESITRTPMAVFLSYPFFPILRQWFEIPRSLSLFAATGVYLAVLLRPDYGIGIAFFLLSLAMIKYSAGLFIIMFFILMPYWAFVSRRWPVLSISPAIGSIFGIIQIPFVFPVLAGLLTNPLIAAATAGIGCVAFELMNLFLKESTMPDLVKGYAIWSSIKGVSNPAQVIDLIVTPFTQNRILLFQPVLWALAAALTSAIRGKRRWFSGAVTGLVALLMGYQGIFTNLKGSSLDMGGLMQGLSFSLIILLLIPIFRPPAASVNTAPELAEELAE
ncbi:MAG: hypothetical protein COW32_07015 [Candidatus Aquicultor secundus]|uniref:non-specific serine/threonine protein kinase n=2 Tax=Candidatus Aquicultor secundus TaxID=1973895 RepID=A0A2M7T7V8_9ACTN|nr:MAG: hypothetical protein COT10_01255 [Candidatus Aquicultor secundus]PIW21965.1 MAG: hypothetical protein COW32_07015 [Candidatus Aquicultor secundus]PIX51355.1 MAG: hypothetical protein COZ51_10165 [Candidatus Aquicultor secundus]PIY38814.1 MAG: hypothetical protein COZ03_07235 [Candidatus Aquicultor secundus]PIZ37222.1 MAG: hypothetical protein COY37_07580 [Candidatus Aquicultor secundus]